VRRAVTVSPHPLGLELHCTLNGELLRSQVFRELELMKIEAFAWQEAFTAVGWSPIGGVSDGEHVPRLKSEDM
jgi:hypothetical protein